MKIAITGGTGFVGRHLARALLEEGHEVVLVARGIRQGHQALGDLGPRLVAADISDDSALAVAFAGCTAVAHLAGINRELGRQTYQRVHIHGAQCVAAAARRAGVQKLVLLSFLRARPACGSAYHESKWEAEQIVRASGLDYTILKAGIIYGQGDHMLDALSHMLHTVPVFPLVGRVDQPVRPVAVEDVVGVLRASLVDGRLSRQTVEVLGPETITLGEAVWRVARVTGRRVLIVPVPVTLHTLFAWVQERMMVVPIVSRAQVRILAEGVVQSAPPCDPLPPDLAPTTAFTDLQIRRGLPKPGGLSFRDCLWFSPAGRPSHS